MSSATDEGSPVSPGLLCLQGGRELTPDCRDMDREVLGLAGGSVAVLAGAARPGTDYAGASRRARDHYAAIDAEAGGRKRYSITDEGKAFLVANRDAIDELMQRVGIGRANRPAPIVRAMENLKLALRLRLKEGPVEQTTIEAIATIIDTAARDVEKVQ